LTLLGLGDDGHTASLLPGQPVLRKGSLGGRGAARPGEPRITLTYPALESSALILFLVSGAGKRDASGPGAGRVWAGRRDQAAG
jgi:6-phosphogluconolactonase